MVDGQQTNTARTHSLTSYPIQVFPLPFKPILSSEPVHAIGGAKVMNGEAKLAESKQLHTAQSILSEVPDDRAPVLFTFATMR